MRIRFLADADLNQSIVNGVLRREPSIDFLTARAAGLRGMKDGEVLALAARLGRMLVSHDVGTMPNHYRQLHYHGRQDPGIILVPQSLSVGRAITDLTLVWAATDASEWTNRILWLPL